VKGISDPVPEEITLDVNAASIEREVAALDELDLQGRLRLVDRLAQMQGASASRALGRILEQDGHPRVRARALAALRVRDEPGAHEAMQRGLGDEDPSIRLRVLDALVEVGGETAARALGQVLFGDDDPDLRLSAVMYLAGAQGEVARALLDAVANDADEDVRVAARNAIGMP